MMMHIIDTPPNEIISAERYEEDLYDQQFYPLEYLRDSIGQMVCARLVINRGDEEEFAGNFTVELTHLTTPSAHHRMQPGIMKVGLRLSSELNQPPAETVETEEYCVTPEGLILPTGLRWLWETGYFPKSTGDWDEALQDLVASSPPVRPLITA